MQIKISELFLKEFINPDLDVMDGRTPEPDGKTITNEPKKNGKRPATTDDVNREARYGPLWNHRYGIGISEKMIPNKESSSDIIPRKELSKDMLSGVYQEEVFLNSLNELLKGFVRIQQEKSPEQYNDIVEIVLNEIKKVHGNSQQTIQDSTRDK